MPRYHRQQRKSCMPIVTRCISQNAISSAIPDHQWSIGFVIHCRCSVCLQALAQNVSSAANGHMVSRSKASKVLYAVTLPRAIDVLSHAMQGEEPPRTEQEARASLHGRPPHALLTFGFGGRAVLLRLRPAGGLAQSGENKSVEERSSL